MRLRIGCLLSLVAFAVCGADLPTTLPPHPRLLFAARDLPAIHERIAKHDWARARYNSLKSQADGWLKTRVELPARGGQWFHYYSCPKHGARLRTDSPTRHVCPIDGEVLTGYPYDDVVLMGEHSRLASAVRTLGIMHQLAGGTNYAAKAKEILLAYAGKYESYPLHNIRGEAKVGGGKVGPQTLDESTWLITILEGADCIWDTLSPGERLEVEQHLVRPAAEVIRQHKMKIHNIQCWKNSAVGLAGLLLGDMNLVDESLHGESGYFQQMAKGVMADGAWYEGAWGYHFYTVSAVAHLTEGAYHCGIDLYGPQFKGMFDAPIDFAMPDLQLPAFNDSHAVSVSSQASLYETAFTRYHDDRYAVVLARSGRDSDTALLGGRDEVGATTGLHSMSRNFPVSGYAILAAGKGREATWLCLDYGPHGGGHGHPDKLGFVLYADGRVIAPDPGTANYGVPIQGGWYRTSVAHNTLAIDEQSQAPAEGNCETFISADGFSAVTATAGKIHPGVSFRRTIALIGKNLLVFADHVSAAQDHTFDLAYHNVGKFATAVGEPFTPGTKPGYSYMRDARLVSGTAGFDLGFDLGNGKAARWSMAGGEPTTFIFGTGVGAHTEDRVPMVIARTKGREMQRCWALALGQPDSRLSVAQEPAKHADGSPAGPGEIVVRVVRDSAVHLLVVNPDHQKLVVGGKLITGRIAHLVPAGEKGFEVRNVAQ